MIFSAFHSGFFARRLHHMPYQHRGGHGAHAAGHGGDGVHHRLCGGKLHVAAQFALLVYMDAYVHDGLACPQAVRAHSGHFAHGHHHDVGLSAHFRQVLGAGVAQGHGGVFPVQHHGGWLAHHKAASHHHGTLAGKRNVIILQNLHAGLRGAGGVAQLCVREHPGQRTVRDAVNVLFRAQGGADGAVIELLGQGTEQKTAVDAVVSVHLIQYPEQLLRVLDEVNTDDGIHGCLLFRPLPKQFDDRTVRAALRPEKDVDGITDGSLAGVFTNTELGYAPCTAQACMEILKYYNVPLSGKRAVVVGRSLVVGKPAAMMLDRENATVTLCNSRTQNLPEVCRQADIVVVAMGKMAAVGADCLRAGQTVVDVGIHVNEEGKLCGDVQFAAAEPVVDAITPVPGGVGTVTTSVLVGHVVQAACKKAGVEC